MRSAYAELRIPLASGSATASAAMSLKGWSLLLGRTVRALKSLWMGGALLLTACQTGYQRQGFTGGYSEFLTAPDKAVITFRGNG